MPSTNPITSPVYARIVRDVTAGLVSGVLSAVDVERLDAHIAWCTTRTPAWTRLTDFHHAHSALQRAFESQATKERLPVVRASYFKLLATSNDGVEPSRWDYATAEAWKRVVLTGNVWNRPSQLAGLSGAQLTRLVCERFRPVLAADLRAAAREGGAQGEVALFKSNGLSWAYKAAGEDTHDAAAGASSGIPKSGGNLNGRSVASYAMARALGIGAIMVDTQWAFEVSGAVVKRGIVMRCAEGTQPKRSYMPAEQAEQLRASRGDVDDDDIFKDMWRAKMRPYLPAAFQAAVLKQEKCAVDLVAANWLDFVCAQVDRHDENLFVASEGRGPAARYRGLALIDNDMAFGKLVTDDESLAPPNLQGSNYIRLPQLVPGGLVGAMTQALAVIGDDAVDFWRRCQDPAAPPVPQRPRVARPNPVVVEALASVARNITQDEFCAVRVRMSNALAHAGTCRVMDDAIVRAEYDRFTRLAPNEREAQVSSYWHRVVDLYTAGSTRGACPEADVRRATVSLAELLRLPGAA